MATLSKFEAIKNLYFGQRSSIDQSKELDFPKQRKRVKGVKQQGISRAAVKQGIGIKQGMNSPKEKKYSGPVVIGGRKARAKRIPTLFSRYRVNTEALV